MRLKPFIVGAALVGGAVVVAGVVKAARTRSEIHTGFGAVPRQQGPFVAGLDDPTPDSEVHDYGLDSGGAEEVR